MWSAEGKNPLNVGVRVNEDEGKGDAKDQQKWPARGGGIASREGSISKMI